VRRRWRAVRLASAALLLVFGVLLVTGYLSDVTADLARYTDWQL
jgi:hypothetical protein